MGAKLSLGLILLLPVLLFPVLLLSAGAAQSTLLWQKTWGGAGDESVGGVVVDSSGDIYVVGTTGSFGGWDASLLKYSSTGTLLWQRTWNVSHNYTDASDVALDSLGNIYISGRTGFTNSSGGYESLFLLKLNSTGSLLWQRTWGIWMGGRIAVDSSGNIYVTAEIYRQSTKSDALLLKFNSSGSLLWQESWDNSHNDEQFEDVAVDSSGSAYVTGRTCNWGVDVCQVFLLKFDSAGVLQWQETWQRNIIGSDIVSGGCCNVAVDSSDNIYVTGSMVLLLKFNPAGGLLWQRTWVPPSMNGPPGPPNYLYQDVGGIAVDSTGNIYIGGYMQGFMQSEFCGPSNFSICTYVLLLKFDSSGGLLWQRMWGPGDYATVAVDSYGNPVIAGRVFGPPPYKLGAVGNHTLQSTNYSVGVLNGTITTLQRTLGTPTGTLETPSGSESYAGGKDQFLVVMKGQLATFTVDFQSNPASGGSILLNGTAYSSGQNGDYSSGNVSISANPNSDYIFGGWSTAGGVFVTNATASTTTANLTDLGILEANFIETIAHVTFYSIAGSINFNGTLYTKGQVGIYPLGVNVTRIIPLNVTATAVIPEHYTFKGWSTTGKIVVSNASANPTTVTVSGSGSLTANLNALACCGPPTPISPGTVLFASLSTSTVLILARRRRVPRI